jgi:hypothetical protein
MERQGARGVEMARAVDGAEGMGTADRKRVNPSASGRRVK